MGFMMDSNTHNVKDLERDVELRSVRGFSSGHKEWEILWGDQVIGFTAKDTKTYGGETKNIPIGIEWFVASMKIPEALSPKRGEVMGLIKEALQAQWECSGFEGSAVVKFDQRLIQDF